MTCMGDTVGYSLGVVEEVVLERDPLLLAGYWIGKFS
jgi:hypothetical protein